MPSAQIPVGYGGQGASWLSILRVVREFARTDGSLAHLFGYHHLPLNLVLFRGSSAQKDHWLRASAAGNLMWGNSDNAMSKTSSGRRVDYGLYAARFRHNGDSSQAPLQPSSPCFCSIYFGSRCVINRDPDKRGIKTERRI
ncbi:acyl-CoA dehydrogenase family protein [Rhizobium brockwellii]|uniref:acyl-CoA dehydrogenase family protein n=1 Tax=Rhizobium brockwellii TaxID=3019932 RepID=UPI001FE1D55D|nr:MULTISPECIES: acyl-CoA dehydrogenase family protein [Rhizobium]MDV4156579.1 acyl-CoA dehydrogenase family protein [Rhizobium brockwellii]